MADFSAQDQEASAQDGKDMARRRSLGQRPRVIVAVAAGLVLAIISLLPGLSLQRLAPAATPAPQPFSQVDDFNTQYRELVAYLQATGQPGQITQVDLATKRKISQFTDIDSSAKGYGTNACGLVAAAAALGGDNWSPLVATIAKAAGPNYQPSTGIQPSKYVTALQQVFGMSNVRGISNSSLGEIYQALAAKDVVIVDVKVNQLIRAPSAQPPHYAHFAHVLGLDIDRQVIYLENTLHGDPYWSIPLADFWEAWKRPETSASIILDPLNAEDVTRWAVIISGMFAPKPSG